MIRVSSPPSRSKPEKPKRKPERPPEKKVEKKKGWCCSLLLRVAQGAIMVCAKWGVVVNDFSVIGRLCFVSQSHRQKKSSRNFTQTLSLHWEWTTRQVAPHELRQVEVVIVAPGLTHTTLHVVSRTLIGVYKPWMSSTPYLSPVRSCTRTPKLLPHWKRCILTFLIWTLANIVGLSPVCWCTGHSQQTAGDTVFMTTLSKL